MRTRAWTTVVLCFDDTELLDVYATPGVLTRVGRNWNYRAFRVLLASVSGAPVKAAGGVPISVQHSLADCPTPEVLLLPGGYGARRAASDEQLLSWLGAAYAGAAHVGVIGNGALLLGAAACLGEAERLAAHAKLRAELAELGHGARLADTPLATGGKLISVSDSGGAIELGLELISRALSPKLALGVAAELDYPWQPREQSRIRIIET